MRIFELKGQEKPACVAEFIALAYIDAAKKSKKPVPSNNSQNLDELKSKSVLFKKEGDIKNVKVNSICKFEFIDKVKSKNIDQNSKNLVLKLIAIDIIKNNENFEINLIFSDNACIILHTEIIEVTLEDQNKNI